VGSESGEGTKETKYSYDQKRSCNHDPEKGQKGGIVFSVGEKVGGKSSLDGAAEKKGEANYILEMDVMRSSFSHLEGERVIEGNAENTENHDEGGKSRVIQDLGGGTK